MHVDDQAEFRRALHNDDIQIMKMFKDLVSTDDGEQAVLSLKTRQEAAEGLLNLIDRVRRQTLAVQHLLNGTVSR